MENLVLHKREKGTGHGARRARKSGKIPGIIYGKNISNMLFEIGELELNKEIYKNGECAVINVELDGEIHKALVKEIQRDPVEHKIVHMDLEEIPENENIQTEIPIFFSGEDIVAKKGAAAQKERNSVKVECKVDNLPKHVNVNLSRLQIGDTYRIGDIELSRDISIIDDLNAVVASITANNRPSDIPVEENKK
jgi:large subunit ribosomal protein L25